MRIIDKYILREMINPFLLALGGFIVFMFSNVLFILADQIINKGVPAGIVGQMLLLRLPAILVLAFPVSGLFATFLGLGRLSSQNEISALRTSGVRFLRIMAPIFIIGAVLTGLTFYINERVSPWATHQSEVIVRKMIMKQTLPYVQSNTFVRGPHNRIFYVGGQDEREHRLHNVMIFELTEGRFAKVITADQATYDRENWYLKNATIHKYDSEGLQQYEVAARGLEMKVDMDPEVFLDTQKGPHEMSIHELSRQVQLFAKSGIDTKERQMTLNLKISLPFACFITCIIAAPLSIKSPRSGGMVGIAISIVIILVYYGLLSVFFALGKNGVCPPPLAAWIPNLVMGGVGGFLIWQEER